MSVYFMANIRICDEQQYNQYLELVDSVFSGYNGTYLAVDNNPCILEGKWDYTKVVLIHFPSESDFSKWYESEEYQKIIAFRLSGAQCDTLLVHGNKNKA